MSNIAIEFQNVGKMYRLGRVGTGTLSHDLNRWWQMSVLGKEDPYLKIGQTNDRTTKGVSDYVWALRDISFKVEQGDVVGIIGKNGAGKSTLLKLLSNITSPSTGSIKYQGRIASLLEVGTGFHPEMTARENIYMNGSIMGMTKPEITRKLDEIVDFAGVERYLDTPVKRFSSGMTVRLGFAVAAFLEPEILVVDEVLAVGDAEFQKKAIGKMKDVSTSGGRTVLFVSHNMNSVKLLCNNGIVLKNGMVDFIGNVQDAVNHYTENSEISVLTHKKIEFEKSTKDNEKYSRKVVIAEARILNHNASELASDETIEFEVILKRLKSEIRETQICLSIINNEDVRVSYHVSNLVKVGETTRVKLQLKNHGFPKGFYWVRIETGLRDFSSSENYNYDAVARALSFYVKYIFKDKRNEYLTWNNAWGLRYEEDENFIAEVL